MDTWTDKLTTCRLCGEKFYYPILRWVETGPPIGLNYPPRRERFHYCPHCDGQLYPQEGK